MMTVMIQDQKQTIEALQQEIKMLRQSNAQSNTSGTRGVQAHIFNKIQAQTPEL